MWTVLQTDGPNHLGLRLKAVEARSVELLKQYGEEGRGAPLSRSILPEFSWKVAQSHARWAEKLPEQAAPAGQWSASQWSVVCVGPEARTLSGARQTRRCTACARRS